MAPVVAQRVSQVHLRSALGEHVGRPVPAVGGFQHHLGVLAALGQLGGQVSGSLSMRTVSSVSPSALRRTMTERLRCRSTPTYCFFGSTGFSFRRLRVGLETPSVLDTLGSRRREGVRRWTCSKPTFDLAMIPVLVHGARAPLTPVTRERRCDEPESHMNIPPARGIERVPAVSSRNHRVRKSGRDLHVYRRPRQDSNLRPAA